MEQHQDGKHLGKEEVLRHCRAFACIESACFAVGQLTVFRKSEKHLVVWNWESRLTIKRSSTTSQNPTINMLGKTDALGSAQEITRTRSDSHEMDFCMCLLLVHRFRNSYVPRSVPSEIAFSSRFGC